MRRWFWYDWYGKKALFIEEGTGPMGPMSAPVLICDDVDEEIARFIENALNALETRLASEDWPMLTAEEEARLSPRGHAVMEDLAAYEAVMPRVHTSPSSPIDEVGDS